jgi:hypothetical protein
MLLPGPFYLLVVRGQIEEAMPLRFDTDWTQDEPTGKSAEKGSSRSHRIPLIATAVVADERWAASPSEPSSLDSICSMP